MFTRPFNIVIKNSLDVNDSLILMGVTSDTTIQFTPTDTVTYSISFLSDVNGCLATDFGTSTTFNVRPLPLGTMLGDATICSGESTDLTVRFHAWRRKVRLQIERVTGGVTDTLNLESGTDDLVVSVNPTGTTVYRLISITDANGCSSVVSESVTVNVNQSPTADFTFDPNCLGFPAMFTNTSITNANQ